MNAPDKIYLNVHKGLEETQDVYDVASWDTEEWDDCVNIRYISKEALLEWAKKRYQQTVSNVGCYTGHSVWAEVIEYIESL